jgi:hypothetical protein
LRRQSALVWTTVFHTVLRGFDSRPSRQVQREREEPLSNPDYVGRTERIQKTVDILCANNTIPHFSAFDITEEMLDEYIRIYGSLGTGENKKFQKGFARKLAGLELLRLKFSRGAKVKDCKEGMVYLIANPAWPDHIKIGMTVDVAARLDSYQTYDPFKAFHVKHYDFCLDRRAAEKKLLEEYGIHLVDGEWIKYSDALEIIKVVRTY